MCKLLLNGRDFEGKWLRRQLIFQLRLIYLNQKVAFIKFLPIPKSG